MGQGPFRKVRLDAREYVWLQLESVKSVGRVDGQVLLETDTQTYALDPDSDRGTRTPEQILADAMGEGTLADCIPTLKAQISELIDARRREKEAVDWMREIKAELAADIRKLRAERAEHGLSVAETGQAGVLSIFRKRGA